jgi:hypothetical protein
MLKFAALAMAVTALAGCGSTAGERALTGGAIGAGAGGLIGGDVTGAVVGGAVGAGVGAATTPNDHHHH